MARLDPLISLLPAVLILLHLYLAPYTKVEESFNIQAIHDFLSSSLRIGRPKEQFDHFEFTGAVPRSALGAYVVALVTWAIGCYGKLMGSAFGNGEGRELQLIGRGVLGLGNAWALWRYQIGLEKAFGKGVGRWFVLFLASQFHVIFYASRTWPNMFAFMLTTLAQRRLLPDQIQSRQSGAIWYFVAAGVIFRSEIAILLAVHLIPSILTSLTLGAIPYRTITVVLSSFVASLLLTLFFDSIFWDRILWPELSGLYFNVVQGKSSEWGTSPYHIYFTNLLPKMLKNPAILVLIPISLGLSVTRKSAMKLVGPTMTFVSIYSLQPHKELRFIIYVVPPLTAAAAVAASQFSARRSLSNNLIALVIFGLTILTFALSSTQLLISSLNYPGGEAMSLFHAHVSALPSIATLPHRTSFNPKDLGFDQETKPSTPKEIKVHVDVLSCMTGITRFLQSDHITIPLHNATTSSTTTLTVPIKYDKTEDPNTLLHPNFWSQFDYALMEEPGKAIGKWEVVRTIYGFAGWNELVRPGEQVKPSLPYSESVNDTWHSVDVQDFGIQKAIEEWSTISRYEMLVLIREFVRNYTGGWWYGPRMEPKIYILRQVDI